ncbi:dDENN domain protein, partial [Cooperia oncophora]
LRQRHGQGCADREAFDDSRDSLVCFDKASFLSDQPDSHLAFLAAFLETQMFTSLIDAKILSQWEAPDENLVLFDSRIAAMREKLGLSMVRTPTYESTPPFAHTEELISKREETLDYVVPGPHELAGAVPMRYDGVWPEQINTALLEGAMGLSPAPSPWKQRYPRLRPKQQEAAGATGRPSSTYGGAGLVGDSPALVAQQQLKFVDQLLRETKGKTKRMLVDKMGKEAVQLGHLDAGITGVEENTLVASFCDLLERIWAHGLVKKQGKVFALEFCSTTSRSGEGLSVNTNHVIFHAYSRISLAAFKKSEEIQHSVQPFPVSMLDATILVQRPGSRELPIFDDSLASMFQYISVEKFLRLFACFLLEHQILLCSKEYSRLMCVSESLCALAFPFRWQMVYVPILPYSQLKFVEAPVPYVMGWCYEESVPEFLFQSNVCVLDIDTGRTEFPEDLPSFPGAKQLCQEIKAAIERYSTWDDMSKSVISGTTPSGSPAVTNRSRNIRRTEEWSAKRMSRSFDRDDAIDDIISESVLLSPRPSRADLTPLPLEGVLKNNSTVARVAEIARRAGVLIDVQDLEQELSCKDQYANSPVCKQYFQNARLNNAIRECVLNRIVCMLYSYEHFVVGGQGCADREAFDDSRDSLVCFDKASFLSDQPDSHLAFLAAFLETQMFTSLIDAKILSQWEAPDENLVLFDSRIAAMREKLGLSMVRTPTYESTPPFAHTEELISKREETLDYVVPGPHELAGAVPMRYDGVWPEQINTALLEGAMGLSPAPSPWKQRYPRLRPKQQEAAGATGRPSSTYGGAGLVGDSPALVAQQQLKFVDQLLRETKGKTKRMLVDKMGKEAVQLGHLDAGITGVEENTLVASFCDLLERIWAHGLVKKQGKSSLWSFVLQHQDLEKACLSTRTMSSSMLTPGDGPRGAVRRTPSLPYCEVPAPVILQPTNENDFAGALSEIVESIQRELGKGDDENAPAWSRSILRAANFLADKLANAPKEEPRGALSTAFTQKPPAKPPAYPQSMMKKSSSVGDFTNSSWNSEIGANPEITGSPRRRSQSRPRSPEMGTRVVLAPLPTHVAYDLKNVLRMTEIKTDIGYARAFVRLALERKLLHRHLATLLGNSRLLSELYKQYAFVRCEDEREQFLYHILSLNAAQFRCFTNTFTKTKMDYQVVIVTGGWRGSLPAVWVTVGGSLCSSPQINLPANTPLFKFDHKNLGVLSTLRIGHAPGSEKPPKWYLECVIVRNEITGQMYRFPCGRWFGQGVEDNRWFGNGCDVSLERLLVAEPVYEEDSGDSAFSTVPNSPARSARRGRVSSRSQTPQRERSPSQSRGHDSTPNRKTRITEIQQLLGEAVNSLVKYFYSEKHSKSELAHLLCGERGLVNAIEQAFQFGRHGSVWLFRQPSPWDYVGHVRKSVSNPFKEPGKI